MTRIILLVTCVSTLAACAPEPGPDGLVRTDNPYFAEAWIAPGRGVGNYDAITLANADIETAHEDRQKLVDTITAEIAEELWHDSRFEFAESPGEGVLVVAARFGEVGTGLREFELRDSESGAVLYRASSGEIAGAEDIAAGDWAGVRRWSRVEARRLRQGLDAIRD